MKKNVSAFLTKHWLSRMLLQEIQVFFGRRCFQNQAAKRSWSEEGEDELLLELARQLGVLKKGFYVDVGANLPTKRSNTFRLYCSGMSGLTIEPNLELAALHERIRPRDYQLSVAVGSGKGIAWLHKFNFHVFSTCSVSEAKKRRSGEGGRMIPKSLGSSCVAILPLRDIITDIYNVSEREFFLLKTDTEGFDGEVISSNDWEKLRPQCILSESNDEKKEVSSFLAEKGYSKFHSFTSNDLFLRNDLLQRVSLKG